MCRVVPRCFGFDRFFFFLIDAEYNNTVVVGVDVQGVCFDWRVEGVVEGVSGGDD